MRSGSSRIFRLLLVSVTAALLLSCAKTPPRPQLGEESLGFLVTGRATREQLVMELGIPSYTFEADHILVYRMTWTEETGLRAISYAPQEGMRYHLVLVFDDAGVLERWALLEK